MTLKDLLSWWLITYGTQTSEPYIADVVEQLVALGCNRDEVWNLADEAYQEGYLVHSRAHAYSYSLSQKALDYIKDTP